MVNKLSIAHCSDIHLGANSFNDEVTINAFSLVLRISLVFRISKI